MTKLIDHNHVNVSYSPRRGEHITYTSNKYWVRPNFYNCFTEYEYKSQIQNKVGR